MKRWIGVAVVVLAGCSNAGGGADASESGTGSDSVGTESGSSSESESETESESGELDDLPSEPARPELQSPAEAEDLDPDPDVVRVALTAAPHEFELDGELVQGWAYNGQIPGPTIRVERGNSLIVEFHNGLDSDTTIHWHGLRVPFAMDGVTWQGQAVGPGQDFEYSFVIDQAGTYWYHPHVDTDRQVDLGLYGVIVAEDPADPVPDRELVVVFDSWDEFSFDSDEGSDHHGLDGAVIEWTANGLVDPVFPAQAGERIRVRAVNVANAGYVALSWPALRQIGSDQGLLSELLEPASMVLAPGDRVDAEWLVGGGFDVIGLPYSLLGAPAVADERRLFEVEVDTPGAVPEPLAFPFDGIEPTADSGWTDVLYVFHGDPHTGFWTINGELFPDITIESLPLGQWAIIELRNVSQSAHPFHLHGHAFELLSVDGVAPASRRIEDTVDVAPYSIVRLGLWADNPGDWMAHCHILPHVDGGMMTVLRVEE